MFYRMVNIHQKLRVAQAHKCNSSHVAGTQVTTFMNENWEEVYKSMSPAISEAFAQVIGSIVNTIASGLPYDALFPVRGP
jgi:hypothetical protein